MVSTVQLLEPGTGYAGVRADVGVENPSPSGQMFDLSTHERIWRQGQTPGFH
jgi:hypothetical protein